MRINVSLGEEPTVIDVDSSSEIEHAVATDLEHIDIDIHTVGSPVVERVEVPEITSLGTVTLVKEGPRGPAGVTGLAGPTGAQGLTGPQGVPGTGSQYTHVQNDADDTWIVEHNLGYNPHVTVMVGDGLNLIGAITYTDVTTLEVAFTAPYAGVAYLS